MKLHSRLRGYMAAGWLWLYGGRLAVGYTDGDDPHLFSWHRAYENPNLMLKHYSECTRGEGGEKTVEELRNPNWIPVEELFQQPVPTPRELHAANIVSNPT